jgi:hypothetical protein
MDLVRGHVTFLGDTAGRRRVRIKHALRAVEDALFLLEPPAAEGLDTPALKRVRDDLVVRLRSAEDARW